VQQSWLTSKARREDAGPKGDGVFAVAPIAAGETVVCFGGHVCDGDELRTLSERQQAHSIQVDDALFVVCDGVTDEPADYVNHSCEPNVGIRGSIVLVAMVDIAPGDEICFDYAMSDSDDYDEFVCVCGTASCRGLVTGGDWKRPDLQVRYAGWFSSYLEHRIASHSGC
jgi:SET domain-containing protein